MLEEIIKKDKELLIFLNSLGNESWDALWLQITNQLSWIPLFLLIIFLVVKSFGWKKGGFIILSMVILVAFSDQFTNLIKNSVERLRPNNDPEIKHLLRLFIKPKGYSFMSGHATTSTFFTTFTILLLRNRFKGIYFMILFPMVFAYSRLYLGVHFPIDILVGILIGVTFGNLYYYLFKKVENKIFQ
ncbi:phosphatase PAP2 family protein [uncultured Polaribacter sp.]|uniref:phosphatase PAP2 family protein n=1 Tax=uncultured Polaribacter sp. TaxID=174711 RepID=UPI0026163D07|nr:phosphatase PAP2 family protein [uncultured Polaribacter sp.]